MDDSKKKGIKKMLNFSKLHGAVAGKGYTLRDLAEELDITQQGLNEKLHGFCQFTLAEMIKTCNFLDAPVSIFFDIEESGPGAFSD